MHNLLYKWVQGLVDELEEIRHGIPDTIYNGSLEDVLDEIADVLELLKIRDLAGEAKTLIDLSRNMRVRISVSGNYYLPGLDHLSSRLDAFLRQLQNASSNLSA
ncbi:MAG: hypothetical protein GSR86_03030 [Desulfurococcales archaeon]|nr:hypothetical protein [Desulfurococcales archaeon]